MCINLKFFLKIVTEFSNVCNSIFLKTVIVLQDVLDPPFKSSASLDSGLAIAELWKGDDHGLLCSQSVNELLVTSDTRSHTFLNVNSELMNLRSKTLMKVKFVYCKILQNDNYYLNLISIF